MMHNWIVAIDRGAIGDPTLDWVPIGLFPWNHGCCAKLVLESLGNDAVIHRVEGDALSKPWFGPFDRDYWDAYGLLSAVPFPNEECVTYKDGKYTFHPEKGGN